MFDRKTNAQIMAQDHWAIVSLQTTFHEGDERSRTHPGHGYPAHTTTELVYEPFETEAELLDRIRGRSDIGAFYVIKAQAMRVKTETKLELKPQAAA